MVCYLNNLDDALNTANEALNNTITTNAGVINQNPRLDGFIAEQHHAQTFNLNAKATGSEYRAEVLEPDGTGYGKNSVDIVIKDKNGKIVKRYQCKYCKDADSTNKAFEHGDYRGQQADINGKSTSVIEAPDGTCSNPLTKSKAEQMRDEAQSGKWDDLNWNEYKTKDLAIGIGKQAGHVALQGAAIGVGMEIASKLWNDEEIDSKEVIDQAIKTGADMGVKAAASGALKVASEKEIISLIPKGTPAGTIANIAYVGIESAKIVGKIMTGELSCSEGIDKLQQTAITTTSGLIAMGEGAEIGAAVGTIFGPIGTAFGGFIGGSVGYMAGSKVGEIVSKGAKKICNVAINAVSSIGSTLKNVGSAVCSGLRSIFF